MPRLSIVAVVLALATVVVAVPISPAAAARAASRAGAGRVVVASANLYEGAVLAAPRDLADQTDVRQFARRFAALNVDAPDVVALQEVRGSLDDVVRRLNAAMLGRATYAAITRPALTRDRGRCASHAGRFTVVRDGALVVNTATTSVIERGSIRTWGRWLPSQRRVMGRANAAGCAEHPWARIRATHDGVARDALVVGTHLGPLGHYLKTRAMQELAARSREVAGPDGLAVLAGDFNLPWCRGGAGVTESRGCRVAAGHRELTSAGFGDALRATGAGLGSRGRVDFINTTGRVADAGWDRCYLPHLAQGCARGDTAFDTGLAFGVCQRRALHFGSPGAGCRPRAYARYYSDHPIVTATVQ